MSTTKHLPPLPIPSAPTSGTERSACDLGTPLPPALSKALAAIAALLGEQAAVELAQPPAVHHTKEHP